MFTAGEPLDGGTISRTMFSGKSSLTGSRGGGILGRYWWTLVLLGCSFKST